jgi:tRNA G18 (ribose-2'-O)-methylase SpoU
MGAVFHMPAVEVEVPAVFARLRDRGLRLIGADPRGARSYLDCDLRLPTALVFGSEGAGLPFALREQLDETVRIPMRRELDSLSVGAAAAVLLFEAARQRG